MLNNIQRWFTDELQHYSWAVEEDDWGNDIEKWSLQGNILGRFRPLSGDKKVSADKNTVFIDAKFYCKPDENIIAGDELKYNDDVYEVVYVQNPMNMDKFLQVELKLKQGD